MNEDFSLLVLGGLIGAGLVSPNPTDIEAKNNYNRILQYVEKRKGGLGNFEILPPLARDKKVFNVLEEAFQMYLNGSNKGSSFLCIAILESKLREKYSLKNFEELISKAKDEKIISTGEFHFLNGLRVDRNLIAHNIFEDFSENDAQITFKLTVRLLNNIYK
jgi:hypothetical protein